MSRQENGGGWGVGGGEGGSMWKWREVVQSERTDYRVPLMDGIESV